MFWGWMEHLLWYLRPHWIPSNYDCQPFGVEVCDVVNTSLCSFSPSFKWLHTGSNRNTMQKAKTRAQNRLIYYNISHSLSIYNMFTVYVHIYLCVYTMQIYLYMYWKTYISKRFSLSFSLSLSLYIYIHVYLYLYTLYIYT